MTLISETIAACKEWNEEVLGILSVTGDKARIYEHAKSVQELGTIILCKPLIPDRIHQTQKPLPLMREIVKLCVPGGRIIDPFAGSGTTLLAAREAGYDAVGSESNVAIARAAAERLGVNLKEIT